MISPRSSSRLGEGHLIPSGLDIFRLFFSALVLISSCDATDADDNGFPLRSSNC